MAENFGSTKPFFNGTEYADWKWRMRNYLDSEGVELFDLIAIEWKPPTRKVEGIDQVATRDQWNEGERKHNYRNCKAMSILASSMDIEERRRIQHCDSAYAIWKTLEAYHEGSQPIRNSKMRMLTMEYETFDWKVDESVKAMTDRLINIVKELKRYDKQYSNEEVHLKMLHALPKSFRTIAVSIQEAQDLAKISTDELIGKLLTYEMQLIKDKEVKVQKEKKGIALKVQNEQSDDDDDSDDDGPKKGEDQEAFYLRKYNEAVRRKSFKRFSKKKDPLICYECGKEGHISKNCLTKKDKRKEKMRFKPHKAHQATWDDSDSDDESKEDASQDEVANISFMALIDSPKEVSSNSKMNDDLSYDELQTYYEEKVKNLNNRYNSIKLEILSLEKEIIEKDRLLEELRESCLTPTCCCENETSNELEEENEILKTKNENLKTEIIELKKRFSNNFSISWRRPLDKSGLGMKLHDPNESMNEIGSTSNSLKDSHKKYNHASMSSSMNKYSNTICHYCMKNGHYISKCKIRWEHFFGTNPKGPKLVWVPKVN